MSIYVKHFVPVAGGPRFEIKVDEGGWFSGYLPDSENSVGRADTLAKLEETLERSAKKAQSVNRKQLDIPVYRFRNGRMIRGTVYAIHAGTQRPMARWTDGSPAGQIDAYETDLFKGDMPEPARKDYERAAGAVNAAKQILERHRSTHGLDVRSLTRELADSAGS